MNYRLNRFLLSVEMTDSYVVEEGFGGGKAATKPLPPIYTLKASSFQPQGEILIVLPDSND